MPTDEPADDALWHGNRLGASGPTGDVVQARDVQGGVHFHHSEPRNDATFAVTPSQLPGDVRGFVNRHSELADLSGALTGEPDEPLAAAVSVITGTAGVGKTSLALHWAHRVRHQFPDGQLYVNLRGYDPGTPAAPEQVLDRFLRDLGVPVTAIPVHLEDRASLYRSLLADRRVMVVLDNAATVGQVRPLLPGTSSALALVTSRNRLSGLIARHGALRVGVDILREDDAVDLLGTVTARYRVDDQRHELVELARLCARLPLALRIAAERAASRPMMRLDELIADLRDESGLWDALSADGDDDTDAVRTVFAWSYRALPEPAARLFHLLGLHPGNDFSLPATAALAGSDTKRVRQQLDVLVGAHLLEQPVPGRYQFHDLLRAYALDQVRLHETPDTQRAVLRRVLGWYLHTADGAQTRIAPFDRYHLTEPIAADVHPLAFDSYEAALRWYQVEATNLVGATRAAAEAQLHTLAWQLAAVLRAIYLHQNAFDDWLITGRIGVDSAAHAGDRAGQAEASESLGKAYFQSRRLDEAESSHRSALAIRQDIGDQFGVAKSTNALGLIALRHRRLTDARSFFDQSRMIFHDLGERRWEALMRSNLAETLCELQHAQAAAVILDEALAVFRELGDRFGVGNALFLLSWARRELGDVVGARAAIDDALAIAEEDENPVWQAHWLVELGKVQRTAAQPADALTSYQHAASIQRRLGDRSREAFAIEGAGQAYEQMGRVDEAVDFYRVAAETYRDLDDQWSLAQCLQHLAGAIDQQGSPEQARSCREQALTVLAEFDDPEATALHQRVVQALSDG
ncbi:tetratricopeptide repeat protein [Actinoplanes sp. TBRC 11911]|uniref:ATP-binding protein n=1 Tax=Actinoplanes sp. TBRC 11911 TaxID=2729386 RepID=UPI00145CEABF|nr:tetratricopeptide repeat protein [Actinoplanes sp. TBRC 11911]NMO56710.1 tetratricopeptide repeat protein [Actinoplanes sp. TBRC 11911]